MAEFYSGEAAQWRHVTGRVLLRRLQCKRSVVQRITWPISRARRSRLATQICLYTLLQYNAVHLCYPFYFEPITKQRANRNIRLRPRRFNEHQAGNKDCGRNFHFVFPKFELLSPIARAGKCAHQFVACSQSTQTASFKRSKSSRSSQLYSPHLQLRLSLLPQHRCMPVKLLLP